MLRKLKIFVDSPHNLTKTKHTPSGSVNIDIDALDSNDVLSTGHTRNGSELANVAKMEADLAMSNINQSHYFAGFGAITHSLHSSPTGSHITHPQQQHSANSSLCSSPSVSLEDSIFAAHGYRIVHKICDTMQ